MNSNLTLKKNKSNDALEIKEDFNIITTDERQQRNNTSKPIISSTYSNVKKITPSTNGLLTTNNTNSSNNQINSNFQNELSLKLKSITSNKEQQQNNSSPNVTPTTINTNNSINNKMYQSEPLSNSTATTSLSSASSCTSNSDLTLKKDTNNFPNTNKRLAPLATNNDTNGDIDNTNQSYSLLKTTLNINGTTNNKPPILKPKPRGTANNYQLNGAVVNKKILNTTFDSVHNQSTDPLLLNQTSPTTSVTDVSSTNCTPSHQHAVATVDDHITAVQLNSLVKNNNNNNNYRTATLSRPKATTTFTNNTINGDPNQAIYSTTKINATNNDHIVLTTYTNGNGNSLLKTFGSNNSNNNNNNYETTTTLNRKTKNLLDPIPKFPDSRTLERRHVKNSEC